MVLVERLLIGCLLVSPFVLSSVVLVWVLALIGVIGGVISAVGVRWALLPASCLALLESALLLVLAVDITSSVLILHVMLVVLVCSALWVVPVPRWPKPTGPNGVGLRGLDLHKVGQAERIGRVFVWYPSASRASVGRYLQTRTEARALGEVQIYMGKKPWIQSHMRYGRTFTHSDAPTAPGSFPLVVFNHGGAMWPSQNFSLMELLASEGYVVVSVGHEGESAGLVYDGGSVQTLSPEQVAQLGGTEESMQAFANYLTSATPLEQAERLGHLEPTQEGTRSACERWARRTLDAIDWLEAHHSVPADLRAQIDFSRIVYVGMSLGGSVAYRCCQLDRRAIGGVNLDGMIWDFSNRSSPLTTPFLMCYSELAQLREGVIQHMSWDRDPAVGVPFNAPFFANADERTYSVEYPGSKHMNFSDFSWAARGFAKDQLGLGEADPRSMIQAANRLVLTFANDCIGRSRGAVDRYLENHRHWRAAI